MNKDALKRNMQAIEILQQGKFYLGCLLINCFLPALWKFLVMHGQTNIIQDFYMSLLVTFYFILFSGMSALQGEVEKLRKSAVKGQFSVVSMIFILCY